LVMMQVENRKNEKELLIFWVGPLSPHEVWTSILGPTFKPITHSTCTREPIKMTQQILGEVLAAMDNDKVPDNERKILPLSRDLFAFLRQCSKEQRREEFLKLLMTWFIQ